MRPQDLIDMTAYVLNMVI